jgi:anaerobic magnesium-protoporphyrin IX monomethyl ester cyclase
MLQFKPSMKILFSNPPTFLHQDSFFRPVRFPTYNYATPVMHPPLYLAYAAAYLRDRGHEIKFIDAPVIGMSVEDFVKEACLFRPEMIVFETSTPSYTNDIRVAEDLKRALQHTVQDPIKIVFMGPHVTSLPKETLAAPILDAIVMGEYEFSLAEYVERGPVKTPGIGYKNERGEIIINELRPFSADLDCIPFPARDLLPNYRYFDPILKNPFTFIVSGRGCPYKCIFCNWPQHLTGRRYRKRSPEHVVKEIVYLQENYRFKSFLFNDDTFTAEREHALAIAREMIRQRVSIPWGCYARADHDDDELLDTLKKAGCFLLKIGVESANEEILRRSKKNYDLVKVRKTVRMMVRKKFHVHATFAFGLPGETKDSIEETIRFARELNPTTVQFSIAVPYPGTEFYDYLDSQGYLLTKEWDEFMPLKPIYEYPNLAYADMNEALRRAYRVHYLRPKYMYLGIKQCLTQPKVFFGNLRKLSRLIFKKV